MLQSVSLSLGGAVSASDDKYIAWPFKGEWEVEEVYFASDAALAANATNYWTVAVSTNDGAAGSFTSIGSFDTDASGDNVSLAVATSKEISISGAGRAIVQGSLIKLALTLAGTASIEGCLTIVARKVP